MLPWGNNSRTDIPMLACCLLGYQRKLDKEGPSTVVPLLVACDTLPWLGPHVWECFLWVTTLQSRKWSYDENMLRPFGDCFPINVVKLGLFCAMPCRPAKRMWIWINRHLFLILKKPALKWTVTDIMYSANHLGSHSFSAMWDPKMPLWAFNICWM